jgi:hypothetical protein
MTPKKRGRATTAPPPSGLGMGTSPPSSIAFLGDLAGAEAGLPIASGSRGCEYGTTGIGGVRKLELPRTMSSAWVSI